jgi:hypothetical protein
MRAARIMALAPVILIGVMACSTQNDAPTSALGAAAGRSTCDPKKQVCTVDGRMTGGGNTVTVGDVKVTKGLELHCDITLSNNLEINWPGGNNWHLTKPIETADCVDDPSINPEPPPAPFDTFNGTATGSLNGVEGSFIEFTFVDAGEPGGKNDQVRLLIHTGDASTPAALDVPLQFITGGNLQAHYDQPHK